MAVSRAPKGLDRDLIRREHFEVGVSMGALARRFKCSTEAIRGHLEGDSRYRPVVRDDVESTAGAWAMKSTQGNPLATSIGRVAAQRAKGQETAAKAHAELLPLLVEARQDGPHQLTYGQLEVLTGISRGHLPQLVKGYRKAQETNGEGTSHG